ncbi:MAG: Holliday junction resolvase RuvX [Candidatus Marinimicrobia bacterium]|jgi:putative Holliday junction resolvase|nr:Holliday junction resolvase RuvX [Candidatus Neomarinimicrobiota bacterium]MDP6726223.1 Holliday junction resolvase RuvX [Candidatus Neomarinimicrobiota bacterium]|tara:strand:- start:27528 stop:27935 length:408 start_codon:yes stop_codon:yes gene_type:complete
MHRILGIDYGEKRVGLALSDPMQMIASPFDTIPNNPELVTNIQSIIKEKDVEIVVVGLPKGMKGQVTTQTENVNRFVELLIDKKVKVELIDERLTSVSAEKALIEQGIKTGHHKGLIDQTAAAIILQQFLDSQNR